VYTYAFPVLRQYGLHAIAFVIGHAVGTDTYKDTGHPAIPKFSLAQARAMAGVVCVQSHTYDMHQAAFLEPGRARENILIWPDESEYEYEQTLRADHRRISEALYAATGVPVIAVAFPHGLHDDLATGILQSMGVRVTFGAGGGFNEITQNDSQSLLALGRINITNDVDDKGMAEILRIPAD
jgi:peptidoglycan/xylan/chitin deacetylase (PgdA/CDA1 family)